MRKTSKLLTLVTVGFLIFGMISSVAALEVTIRPIEDWLEPNYNDFPWGVEENWAFSDFFSPYSNLLIKMGFPWPAAPPFAFDMIYENSLVEGETIITGYLKERALKDGRALVTMHLDVKNSPLTVYDVYDFIFYCYGMTPKPQAVLGDGEDGYIDYTVLMKFIIPEPGAAIPNVWDVFNNYTSCNIHGIGYGTLTERAVELGFAENAGAPGMVEFHQLVLFKPDLKESHPKYDPYFGELWPVETVEVYELS
jgi:hypothetical protein